MGEAEYANMNVGGHKYDLRKPVGLSDYLYYNNA